MPSREEIVDSFDSYHTYNLLILYNKLKDKCISHGLNLLDNTNYNTSIEFINLIKNNVDLKYYHQNKMTKIKKKS